MKKIKRNNCIVLLFCMSIIGSSLAWAYDFISPPGPPGRPEITNITYNSCVVNFNKPEYDGGSSITGYFIEQKEKTITRWKRVGMTKDLRHKVIGLLDGHEYVFRVCAENMAGLGQFSFPSNPIIAKDPFRPHF